MSWQGVRPGASLPSRLPWLPWLRPPGKRGRRDALGLPCLPCGCGGFGCFVQIARPRPPWAEAGGKAWGHALVPWVHGCAWWHRSRGVIGTRGTRDAHGSESPAGLAVPRTFIRGSGRGWGGHG